MCPLSRRIPVPDQRTIAPMAMPSAGSTHCAPVRADDNRAGKNRDIGERVAQIVQPHGADVQIAPPAVDGQQ